MRHVVRSIIASFIAVPFFVGAAEAQGKDMAIDFRMTESGTSGGKAINGVSTAHAVLSGDRVRYDMTGNTRAMAMPGMAQTDSMSIIMLDSGATLIILQPKKRQYMKMRPGEMMEGMQKMMEGMGTAMKFDFTGDVPKIQKLEAGPVILGHHTTHYRVTGNMKVSMSAMGQPQGVEVSSVFDEFVTPDIKSVMDPFRSLGSNMMGGIFGASFKTYMDKVKATRARVPGFPLRIENRVITTSAGQKSDIKTVQEITAVHTTTAAPGLFEVPAGYTQITMPSMPTMPPRRKPTPSTKSG